MKTQWPRTLLAITTLVAFGAIAAFAGCDTNQSGNIKASRFGDLSHPLGEHASALAEIGGSCDLTLPTGLSSQMLPRRPYLQRMTAGSVDLVWTASAELGGGTVVVAMPGGSVAATASATRDTTAKMPTGVAQWTAA